MADQSINIEHLVKFYDGRCILDGIDLKIPPGCIYGLLGRNGIGKTTLIRILLGLEPPTRGCTSLLGVDSGRLSSRDRGRIGYVAEGHHLIQHYKVGRLIDLCRGVALQWNQPFFDKLMTNFNLPLDRKIKELSSGMRAQLNLTLAMALDPELLILDDPTLGLDTIARRQFLELAIDLIQRDGKTILFSSHILSDVERIADRIGIIAAGKLVVDCRLEELKDRIKKLRIIFPDTAPGELHLTEIINRQNSGREIVLTVANWNEQKQLLLNTYNPESYSQIPLSLEDIFIECTHQQPLNHLNRRTKQMFALIKHEFRSVSFLAIIPLAIIAVLIAVVYSAVIVNYHPMGGAIPLVMFKVMWFPLCFLAFISAGIGAQQMYSDQARKISAFLSTLATSRRRIFAARLLAGAAIPLIAIVLLALTDVIVLLLYPPVVLAGASLLISMFIVAVLLNLASYAVGLLIGWHTTKLLPILGSLALTAPLIGLIVIKGFGLHTCLILIIVTAAALTRIWQKYAAAPL